jgi:uncharacterized protein (TIGR00730 family)
MKIKRIAVFCGSSPGARPEYLQAAEQVGLALVERGIELVYGGSNLGLMGRIAQTVLHAGGTAIGVIPEFLHAKVDHPDLTDLRIVNTMHDRKAAMAELSDGFIALPGGIGTFEEILEMATWSQLGVHAKPCALLNNCGYYTPLLAFLDNAVQERFMRPQHRDLFFVSDSPTDILEWMINHQSAYTDKWLDTNAE